LNLKKLLPSIPAHPFLFAIYPILFLYAHNVDFTLPREALVPMAIAAGLVLVLFLALTVILGDKERAGLLVSLCVLLFFSYGHIAEAIEGSLFVGAESAFGLDSVLLPAWAILLAGGAYFLVRTRRDLHTSTNLLNIAAACLVAVSLISILSYKIRGGFRANMEGAENIEGNLAGLGAEDTFPDIYYIILDAYASASVLEDIWDYDNHEFTDYLTEKGFYIASESHSNYAITFLSLASSLNMEYLNYLSEGLGAASADRNQPYEMIQDSGVVRFLKSRGYKFVHFQSGWGPTGSNKNADWDVQCGSLSEFVTVLVQTTILRPLADHLIIAPDRREAVLCMFSRLPEVQHRLEGPRFVFAHVLVPHPPFLFGSNGEPIDTKPGKTSAEWREYYPGQLEFVNKKVEALVDTLLLEAEIPPIIILQADHGPKSVREEGEPGRTLLKERMGILNAYHLPYNGKESLYESITPVNTFRLVFNLFFDTDYDLLEDKSYFSRLKLPYDFIDVTDTLRGE
jgi:hypothetical protein